MKRLPTFYCPLFIALISLTNLQLESAAMSGGLEAQLNMEVEGVEARRDGSKLVLSFDDYDSAELVVPRFAAPLSKVYWADGKADDITVNPEPEEWVIKWNRPDIRKQTLVIEFSSRPLLLSETMAIVSQSDGSFWLPAHLATTDGEKIRYEPQTFKNTVGYWTGRHDKALWKLSVEKPGKYNLAVLQGCGEGQGGSLARVSVMHSEELEPESTLEFRVEETGHFQDFRWRHLGVIEIPDSGLHTLVVEPIEIAAAALMDIRAVHLIRRPEAK